MRTGTLLPLIVVGMSVAPAVFLAEPFGQQSPETGVGVAEAMVLPVAVVRGRDQPEQRRAAAAHPPTVEPGLELALAARKRRSPPIRHVTRARRGRTQQ